MSGTADSSFTNKIKRLRCRTQAIFRQNNGNLPEQGPLGGVTDESTRQARRLGQQRELRANASGIPNIIICPPPCCELSGGDCI